MIAWLALALGILNLLVWLAVAALARHLYLRAAPFLGMLGLGGSPAPPGGPPSGGAVTQCPVFDGPDGKQCELAGGHDGPHGWFSPGDVGWTLWP